MFHIFRTEEKHAKKYTNDQSVTPNSAKSIALEAQRILRSHTDTMELFHRSKDIKR